MTNTQKGNLLEEAVRIIETSIIQSSPGYLEANFQIEGKKIISVQGVRHEIDVWVAARVATGYEATFLFECKNRAEKTNKNDIIVFSEKVKVANASRGFFVAKSFTDDALAQIALDPRLKPLVVTELDLSSIAVSIPHRTNIEDESNCVSVRARQGFAPRIVSSLPFAWRDERMPIGKFVTRWRGQCVDFFPSATLPAGEYPFILDAQMSFANHEAYLAGVELAELSLSIEGVAVVERAVLVSAFDIESRGRTIRFDFPNPLSLPGGGVVEMAGLNITITPLNPQTQSRNSDTPDRET